MTHFRGVGAAGLALIAVAWSLAMFCALVFAAGVYTGWQVRTGAAPVTMIPGTWRLLGVTLGYAASVATLSCCLGLPVAWAMRGMPRRAALLMLAPLAMPSYLLYTSLGLLRAPGTWLGDHLERGSAAFWEAFAALQAVLGLSAWVWPLAAAIIHVSVARIERESVDAAIAAGAGRYRRAMITARMARGGILGAWGLIASIMLGSAVPFHLAQVDTFSIVVWRMMSETAGSSAAWRVASPLIVIALALGACIGAAIIRAGSRETGTRLTRDAEVRRGWLVVAAGLWCLTTLGPLGLLASSVRNVEEFQRFVPVAGASLGVSALVGAGVATASAVIAIGTSLGLGVASPIIRRLSATATMAWVMGALIPGVLVGSAIASAGSTHAGRTLTETWLGVWTAHVVRFGAVGALAGWWVARSEPRDLRDLRLEAGSLGVLSWVRTIGTLYAPVYASAGLAAGILSLHEIEATVVAAPAGTPSFAQHMLSLLHYLKDDQLAVGALVVGGGALAFGTVATVLLGASARARERIALVLPLGLVLALVGCDDDHPGGKRPVDVKSVFGAVGRGEGQFVYPRAIDTDGRSLFVVDKTARVQRFDLAGNPEGGWMMPAYSKGYPTGVTCGPDGLVYVADTHEHRVSVFRPSESGGEIVGEWGGYGESDGQFIFPTDVAVLPSADGSTAERFYVSEYGGHDRVSAFDRDHKFLFSFGAAGFSGPGEPVRFNRPQAVVCDPRRRVLLISDAANHRIGRFGLDGVLQTWFGSPDGMPSREAGRFSYPYGLALLPDGSLLVVEYGGCRLQRIDPESGDCLGLSGEAGRREGQLVTPWAVAVTGERVFLLDSGNNRVIECAAPRGGAGG